MCRPSTEYGLSKECRKAKIYLLDAATLWVVLSDVRLAAIRVWKTKITIYITAKDMSNSVASRKVQS